MERKEALKQFWLKLVEGKDNLAITAWKERVGYRVRVFELYDEKAEIVWQDAQRTPFWASEVKKGATFAALAKLVPELTKERFDEITREFANADACGDIENRTEAAEARPESRKSEREDIINTSMDPDILEAEAYRFLKDSAMLHRVKQLVEKGFVVDRYRFVLGEDDKKLLIFLAALSSCTPWPQNVWLTGTSGFGKTNLVMTTLALMPPRWVKRRAYLTAAGLRYGDQDYKILFIQEWRQGVEQDARLTSKEDGSYIYEIAGRDTETGEMVTQVGEISAKTIITTSAERLPSAQMLRRCWLLSVDETPELTKQINQHKAKYAVGKVEPANPDEVAVIQRAIMLLEPVDVLVPYAEELVDLAPWDRTRLDFLNDIIRVIAWLYQRQRPNDERNRIVATAADLYVALRVAWPTLAQTLGQLPDRLRRCLNALPTDPNAYGKTSRDLARELGLSQSTIRDYLSDLINLGYAHEDRIPGERSKRYWASGRSAEVPNTAESVIRQLKWQEIARISKSAALKPPLGNAEVPNEGDPNFLCVDPITGNKVDIHTLSGSSSLPKEGEIKQESEKEAQISELSAEASGSAQFGGSALPDITGETPVEFVLDYPRICWPDPEDEKRALKLGPWTEKQVCAIPRQLAMQLERKGIVRRITK